MIAGFMTEKSADNFLGRINETLYQETPKVYPSNSWLQTRWIHLLRIQINSKIFENFSFPKLLAYDATKEYDDSWMDPYDEKDRTSQRARINLERVMHQFQNTAFVPKGTPKEYLRFNRNKETSNQALIVTKDSDHLKKYQISSNTFKVRIHFPDEKFLVYNDSYHKDWHVFIDGQEAKLLRANIAFKGVWVPPGEHSVEFKFGQPWRFMLNYFVMAVFYLWFGWFVMAVVKKNRNSSPRQR